MIPYRDRVVSALALQPMTVLQLSRCLDLSRQQVHQALRRSSVTRAGTTRSGSRPFVVYRITNEFCHAQKGEGESV
jgi:hypothetical protein